MWSRMSASSISIVREEAYFEDAVLIWIVRDCETLSREQNQLMSCVFLRYVHEKAAIITPLTKKLLRQESSAKVMQHICQRGNTNAKKIAMSNALKMDRSETKMNY